MNLISTLHRPWKGRVIDRLREIYPELTWRYEGDYGRQWHCSAGWYVYAEALSAPRYDGDDDTFITQYRRSDNYALVQL